MIRQRPATANRGGKTHENIHTPINFRIHTLMCICGQRRLDGVDFANACSERSAVELVVVVSGAMSMYLCLGCRMPTAGGFHACELGRSPCA
jgi:hypothetical protein